MEDKTNFLEIKNKVKKFCQERDWDQFHNAKELSTALILEAAELLDFFRYKSEKEVEELMKNPEIKGKISEEMADIILPLFRLAQIYDIDLADSFFKKMDKNEKKYPVEKSKGSNKKYTEL